MATKTASKQKQESNSKGLILWIVGGVVGLGLIAWLAVAIAGEEGVDDSIAFRDVSVAGEALPFFDSQAGDPAVGLTAPTLSGSDWNDNEITIGADGRAKIVVMLAHWCPFCQAEVPEIQAWVDAGGLPEGVDLYGATILTNRVRDGRTWPPQNWLEGEGWTSPTIMDDQSNSIVTAYGVQATPTYVILGPNNENLGRVGGATGIEGLSAMAAMAAASLES